MKHLLAIQITSTTQIITDFFIITIHGTDVVQLVRRGNENRSKGSLLRTKNIDNQGVYRVQSKRTYSHIIRIMALTMYLAQGQKYIARVIIRIIFEKEVV
jgi:hypothetical protein